MEMVKGYKGYNKDLTCKGKQYAENTLFEEEKAIMCNSGMHFCENPLDVLDFYGFVNKKGEINEFTEVQACGEVLRDDEAIMCNSGMHFCENPLDVLDFYGFVNKKGEINEFTEVQACGEVLRDDGMKKCCTNKLKVGVKLGIKGFIEACVDFLIEKTTYNGGQIDSGYAAQIGSSGFPVAPQRFEVPVTPHRLEVPVAPQRLEVPVITHRLIQLENNRLLCVLELIVLQKLKREAG